MPYVTCSIGKNKYKTFHGTSCSDKGHAFSSKPQSKAKADAQRGALYVHAYGYGGPTDEARVDYQSASGRCYAMRKAYARQTSISLSPKPA